jgi:hypothetical protein
MTIIQLNESQFLAILKIHSTVYSAIASTQKSAHVAVMGVLYG